MGLVVTFHCKPCAVQWMGSVDRPPNCWNCGEQGMKGRDLSVTGGLGIEPGSPGSWEQAERNATN